MPVTKYQARWYKYLWQILCKTFFFPAW